MSIRYQHTTWREDAIERPIILFFVLIAIAFWLTGCAGETFNQGDFVTGPPEVQARCDKQVTRAGGSVDFYAEAPYGGQAHAIGIARDFYPKQDVDPSTVEPLQFWISGDKMGAICGRQERTGFYGYAVVTFGP